MTTHIYINVQHHRRVREREGPLSEVLLYLKCAFDQSRGHLVFCRVSLGLLVLLVRLDPKEVKDIKVHRESEE